MRSASLFLGTILLFLFLAYPAAAYRFDDADELKGQYIVEVGDLRRLSCPIGGRYDCLTWPAQFYQMGYSRCFEVHGYGVGYGDYALLAVDDAGHLSLFAIKSYGSDITQFRITMYDCPVSY